MTIPARFKPITMYIRRAEKLDNAPEAEAPVVAYYCRLYATEQAMSLQDNGDERCVEVSSLAFAVFRAMVDRSYLGQDEELVIFA